MRANGETHGSVHRHSHRTFAPARYHRRWPVVEGDLTDYFQRTDGSVSGCDFLEQVPPKVAATMKATLIAVAKAPPVRFCQPRTVGRRPSQAGISTRRLAVAGVFGAFFCLTVASVSPFASEVGGGARVILIPRTAARSDSVASVGLPCAENTVGSRKGSTQWHAPTPPGSGLGRDGRHQER